jgi:hypothetical protein
VREWFSAHGYFLAGYKKINPFRLVERGNGSPGKGRGAFDKKD